jgi:hypothetical protein
MHMVLFVLVDAQEDGVDVNGPGRQLLHSKTSDHQTMLHHHKGGGHAIRDNGPDSRPPSACFDLSNLKSPFQNTAPHRTAPQPPLRPPFDILLEGF